MGALRCRRGVDEFGGPGGEVSQGGRAGLVERMGTSVGLVGASVLMGGFVLMWGVWGRVELDMSGDLNGVSVLLNAYKFLEHSMADCGILMTGMPWFINTWLKFLT